MPDENQDFLYYTRYPPNPCPNDYEGPYGIKSTTNMTGHLKRYYKIIVNKTKNKTNATMSEQLKQYYYQAEVNGNIIEFNSKVLKKYLFQAVITKALVTLIIIRNLSFYIVKWPEFHTFY
jgi:hypothetical protein